MKICNYGYMSNKRVYKKPELITLGDIRCVVMGPSAGTGESVGPLTRKSGMFGSGNISSPVPEGNDPFAPTQP